MGWDTNWNKDVPPVQDVTMQNGQTIIEWPKQENKSPTHDPYTNPGAYVYYQCECGETFDPHVKSFAALNNTAMNSEWKIRWGNEHYIPYCPKCVKDKGIE